MYLFVHMPVKVRGLNIAHSVDFYIIYVFICTNANLSREFEYSPFWPTFNFPDAYT